ncbi:tryptophan-rich sensory protein [Sphingomonas sp. CGMCC 1.13654]|uniref:Tryptophan-rich sensory protein n=1 Tax=Sphingomonas chungangi TaxID=2683589 RepID=A0A838LE56_9SPHN|nr:TspO/MBR family protein [Sphingomonas chungangi]MBA2935758.1 tryptophan-rich sensory protein [Sphingomonas chungangi]MVW54449.1 tryptophan-rich sensory protein [Sphingomonas chungangi]
MSELASAGQLRMSFLRVALVTVPLILFLGILSGALAGSGFGNPWFASLAKPAAMPPGWVFPVAWTLLYILIGFALAMIVWARGASGRGIAIGLFLVQFALNLAWSPVFFAGHKIGAAFAIILLMIVVTIAAILSFARIRSRAALLMLPYLVWLCFAAYLNHAIEVLNPNAETLAPAAGSTQVQL